MKPTSLLLTCLIELVAIHSTNAQLIINGGFETPDTPTYMFIYPGQNTLAPWVVGSPYVEVGDAVGNGFITGPAFEGVQMLDLHGRLTQAFATTPGSLYTVTFAYTDNPAEPVTRAPASARVRLFDGLGDRLNQTFTHIGALSNDFKWTVFHDQFAAVTNTTSLEFTPLTSVLDGDPGGILLDAVQVTLVPIAVVVPSQSFVLVGGSLTLGLTNAPAAASTYQWQFNGTNLNGAISATLALNSLTPNDSGPYRVTISNAFQVVTTAVATVQVIDSVTILSQPSSTNAPAGSNVTLRVTAVSPLPITYQWQFNGTDLPNQTNAALALTNLQFYHHTGDYRVQVSDTASNVWSDVATLLVLQRPVITNQPVAQTVLQGGTAVFSVTAGPDHPLLPLVYRWLRNGVTWASNVPPTLVITNCQTNGSFRCQLINAAGNVSSATVNLTVLADFDGDGLADAWEKQYGFDTNSLADAALDFDGDGMSNRDEYNAGTNPTNASSVLQLQLSPVVGGQAALSFLAMSNRTYTVEWNAAATGGTWNRVQDVLAQPAERIESVSDTNASGAMRLYRVVTPKRP